TATRELTDRFNSGGTALHALTGVTGANIRTAELDNFDSGAIDVEDALTTAQTDNTVRAGAALADAEVDSGADLLLPATVGVGSSTPASVIVAAMIDTEPVAVVGRGSGIDDRTWMRKAAVVRDALRRSRTAQQHPLALLRIVGGADLAAATGFLAQAAVRRTPVLLDGLTSVAAALLAERLATGARAWWLAPHSSPEPAHSLALRELELTPLLDLGITLQQGAAASTALPLLHMAARTLHDMPPRAQADLTQPWGLANRHTAAPAPQETRGMEHTVIRIDPGSRQSITPTVWIGPFAGLNAGEFRAQIHRQLAWLAAGNAEF